MPVDEQKQPDVEPSVAHDATARTIHRRRRRATPRRRRGVSVAFGDDELARIDAARGSQGRGAFIALAALAVATGEHVCAAEGRAAELRELMAARLQVQRFGTLVNQAVARLNATGTPPPQLANAIAICGRAVSRLDEAVAELRAAR